MKIFKKLIGLQQLLVATTVAAGAVIAAQKVYRFYRQYKNNRVNGKSFKSISQQQTVTHNYVGRDMHIINYNATSILSTGQPIVLKVLQSGEKVSWAIPTRVIEFIGRSALTEGLQAAFSKSNIVAYTGLGGSGKTQLALHYVHDSNYQLKGWFSAETQALLEQGYIDFAKALGIGEEKPTPTQAISYVKALLSRRQDWLLVLDNVENLESIKSFLPEGGNILLTTQYQRWPAHIQTLPVVNMTEEEALQLLRTFIDIKETDIPESTGLIQTLGHLPLAIAQAGAYLKETQTTFTEYLALYREHALLLLQDNTLETHPSAAVTLDLSLKKLMERASTKAEQLATSLLTVCAYLGADNIPISVLSTWYKKAYPNLNPIEYHFNNSLAYLKNFSLAKHDNACVSVHQVVQTFMQHKLQADGEYTPKWYHGVGEALHTVFHLETNPLEDESRKKELLPHLKKLITHYSTLKIIGNENEQALGLLLSDIGYVHAYFLADYETAKNYLDRALAILKRSYGEDHVEVAITLNILGNTYVALGNYIAAETYLQRAWTTLQRHYGKDDVKVARALRDLSTIYGILGYYLKEETCLKNVLAVLECKYGTDHMEVAITHGDLGTVYASLGNYNNAKKHLEHALAILEQTYGKDHVRVTKTLINLAINYGNLGNYPYQKILLERALAILEQTYGKDHVRVAAALENLAIAYASLGDYDIAKKHLERALAIKEHAYGEKHVEVATALTNIGCIYGTLKDYEVAKKHLERALAIKEINYEKDHVEIAITLLNLGSTYGALGDNQEARRLLEHVLMIFKGAYGESHVQVAKTLRNLGAAYGSLEDYQRQREVLEQALPIFEHSYGKDHVQVAMTLINLGAAYGSLEKYQRQREVLEQALSIFECRYDHVQIGVTLYNLSGTYGALGDIQTKISYLKVALGNLTLSFDTKHPYVQKVLVELATTKQGVSSSGYTPLRTAKVASNAVEQQTEKLIEVKNLSKEAQDYVKRLQDMIGTSIVHYIPGTSVVRLPQSWLNMLQAGAQQELKRELELDEQQFRDLFGGSPRVEFHK